MPWTRWLIPEPLAVVQIKEGAFGRPSFFCSRREQMLRSSCLFIGSLLGAFLAGASLCAAPRGKLVAVFVAAVLAIAFVAELRQRRAQTKLNRYEPSLDRLVRKSIAIGAGCLMVLGVASLQSALGAKAATVFLQDSAAICLLLPALIPAYVLLCEIVVGPVEDAHATVGAMLMGKRPWRPREHKQLLLSWLVKAFFLPLMYGGLVSALDQLLVQRPSDAATWFVAFALAGLAIDLLVATTGYLATGPLFGKEIRSVDQR